MGPDGKVQHTLQAIMRLRGGGCGASTPIVMDAPQKIDIASREAGAPDGAAWLAATVHKRLEDGMYEIHIDNSSETIVASMKKAETTYGSMGLEFFEVSGEIVDGEEVEGEETGGAKAKDRLPTKQGAPLSIHISTGEKLDARVAQSFRYDKGQKLLVLHDNKLVDSIVVSPAEIGNKHKLKLTDGTGPFKYDLHERNHSTTHFFPSARAYENAHAAYCEAMARTLGKVQDAITNNILDIEGQVLLQLS